MVLDGIADEFLSTFVQPQRNWIVWTRRCSGGVGRKQRRAAGRSGIRTTDNGNRIITVIVLLAPNRVTTAFHVAIYHRDRYVGFRSASDSRYQSKHDSKCSSGSKGQVNCRVHDFLFLWKCNRCNRVNLDLFLGRVVRRVHAGGSSKHDRLDILGLYFENVRLFS